MTGGYPQQGYQSRPPTNWAPPGPSIQQSGYGYAQPGAYSNPSQYNMNQPPYSGYPPQPTSGAYPTGWDQTSGASNQQIPQGGGYDYYNQQPPPQPPQPQGGPGAPADGSGYAYNQSSAYNQGQGYAQDNYSGYHASAGYGQPQQNPGAGYEHQQGYSSAYGSATNPAADGHASSYGPQDDSNQVPASGQPYNVSGQPSPNPAYPSQASKQPGYGVPPSQGGYGSQPPSSYGSYGTPQGQKPPSSQAAYAQPQQSPSAQGGGYAQPGYPHSQPPSQSGYAQTDAGAQKPPSSGYPMSQTGYGPPSYGAPPPAQPGYGQQPPYNSSYASGYSQPSALPSEASGAGYSHGTYDATPPAPQSSGAAKASPPSG